MKNQLFSLIAIATIMGIAIFVAVSCSKTDSEPVKQEGVITHFSPQENMVELTIVNFLNRYESYKAGYKTGGEDLALGEAIWTLEAGVNYEFQSPKDELNEFTVDSVTLSTNVYVGENNEYFIAEEDAMDLFEDMLSFTDNSTSASGSELLASDMAVKSIDGDEAEIILVNVNGKGGLNPCTINNDDYWYAANYLGKCGAYQGQGVGKDATTRIQQILNCEQTMADYWTDVTTSPSIYEGWCPCEYDYCFWEGDYTDCLSPTEMNEWLDKAFCVVEETVPEGYERIDAAFSWDLWGTLYVHYFVYIQYGIPHLNGGGGETK